MRKNSTSQPSSKAGRKALKRPLTVGMDLGDKTSRYCKLDGNGEVVEEGSVATTTKGMAQLFGRMDRCRIAIEVGTHSSMGKPAAEKHRPRSNRSKRTAGETDQRQQPQRRPAGRADAGTVGSG